MLTCPECGSSELRLRDGESSPAVQWFSCPSGHRFSHRTLGGKAAEFSGLIIAAAVVTRLFLDHHGFFDGVDDFFGSV